MQIAKTWLTLFGFSTLATHELDAVMNSEWTILIVFRELPEEIASTLFVAVHVPLFAVMAWLISNENKSIKEWSRIALAAFLIIHVGLHISLQDLAAYSFYSPLSVALIYGGGLIGFSYLLLAVLFRSDRDAAPMHESRYPR